jgi:hypothetical protein
MTPTSPSNIVKHAVLEAFLVHARLVAHFLGWHRNNIHGDDVLAEDFLSSWTPPTPIVLTAIVNDNIHKRVAHLTYKREHANLDGYTWDVSGIAVELLEAVAAFVGVVDQAKLSGKDWGTWKTDHGVAPGGPAGPFLHQVPPSTNVATGMAR